MNNKSLTICLLALIILCISCSTNPLSGKKQLTFLPEAELQAMSVSQYTAFINSHKVIPASSRDGAMVKRVGDRITAAVNRFYVNKGMGGTLDTYQWAYQLVEDQAVNAWCLPGGKIVVYTGILPITQNEDALAVVMGHEVSHALLQHGNQRMSKSMITELGGLTLSMALANKPALTQNIFLNAFGVGAELGIMLPFSRKHELEADRFGLIWAAMAGYDPEAAIGFWTRMSNVKNGAAQPVFLSTHPSDETRIAEIRKFLIEAKSYAEKN